MSKGRHNGLALASGISVGSLMWSAAACFGLAAVMAANAWAFEVLRWVGAVYLLFLAYKSARSAFQDRGVTLATAGDDTFKKAFRRGLLIHLTNPKPVLFFASLYSLGVPPGTPVEGLIVVMVAVGVQSAVLFHALAVLFSVKPVTTAYVRLKRAMDAIFAACFGAVALSLLTAKLR